MRWNIEVFHRTLKSGCRIEDRRLESAAGLQACLAIDLVVAWRGGDGTHQSGDCQQSALIGCFVLLDLRH